MRVSGFTIARDVAKFHYPVVESIKSILPICDEFIVNVGDSEDNTLDIIHSINSPKIKIIENVWDFSLGKEVLSHQTNLALDQCRGDWAFYLQTDEVVHERDLPKLKQLMEHNLSTDIDAIRFKWFHFYGSYYRYRIDSGWYQKQDRIIRNNGRICSMGDAWGFEKKDGTQLNRLKSGAYIYHYGWVQTSENMALRRGNAAKIGFISEPSKASENHFDFEQLDKFPAYFGSHPAVMKEKISQHGSSQEDLENIRSSLWWHPAYWLKLRYKTGRRDKKKRI